MLSGEANLMGIKKKLVTHFRHLFRVRRIYESWNIKKQSDILRMIDKRDKLYV